MFQDRTGVRVHRETNVIVIILSEIRRSTISTILGRKYHTITYLNVSFIIGTDLAFEWSGGWFVRFRSRLIVDRTVSLTSTRLILAQTRLKLEPEQTYEAHI